jgi:thymidylate kinase
MRHLKPRIFTLAGGGTGMVVVDPHAKPPRSLPVSLVKIGAWLVEEWYAAIFQDDKETLLICDRYYHDLLIDPKRYRYGAPLSVARIVGRLIPRPNLWVLLDAPAEVLQARKQEVPLEETVRQRQAYFDFVSQQQHHAIIDASQPLEKVVAAVESVILAAVDGNR